MSEFRLFKDQISEITDSSIPAPIRDLENELFGKKGQEKIVDAFEKELGFGGRKEVVVNEKIYNRIFCPNVDEDQKLLNTLLNDKTKFRIIMWKDTWTAHGDYRIFIVYSENLDAKASKKKDKEEDDE